MVQIKVTPEMLEEVANRANNTRNALESIHNNLCNQIDYLCYQWIGASNQNFVQMFNDARPKAFTSINAITNVEEELKRIAEKFRNADNQDVTLEEGAMCGKQKSDLEKAWDGLYDGAGKGVGDAWEGFKALGDGETWSDMWDTVVNYDETLPAMWNAFSDSFMNDVWHGDVESGFRWGSYLVTSVGLGLLGGKGLDKASKLARGANMYKVTEAFPSRLQPAFAGVGLTGEAIVSTLPPSGNWSNYLSGYLMFARPSWRQSELDALKDNPNYREQVIFKDGLELEKKTKGSSIPDLYSDTVKHAIEVKNYDVSTSAKRTRLAYVIGKQVEARLKNLPEGTTQSIIVDIRRQEISATETLELKKKILDKTNDQVTIEIKKQ
ncbi:type VII secretion protein [Bacillus thuringiensis serovar pingluonsis]|uniref:Type VII secretion protein n=1 Tax=Bacillus thuringiensis serovar pingluonsis TaxID=180881 RepID=A0A243AVK0_BACTU|nr:MULTISPECIES: WXG100 family type VII secretion target [Bacillus cereus group]MEB9682013.1 WXG100 family type VII secretion target [Bacillus anthracis]OTY32895.1 type VII secretion protein [Bacillus thuringiensis serovar pingluonsis]